MYIKISVLTGVFLLSGLLGCASIPPSKTLPQSEIAASSVNHTNYRNYVAADVNAMQAKLQHKKTQRFIKNTKLQNNLRNRYSLT